MTMPPFHLAFPVHDLDAARNFYGALLGCEEGRSDRDWVDYNFFGHQIVAHVAPASVAARAAGEDRNSVDGDAVPVPHFGVVLPMDEWQALADRLTQAGLQFVIEPTVRFRDRPGEQATMFFRDPSGNALEIKAMADPGGLFAKD